ncbi:MAG: hypothetical protein IKS14_00560 [Thermoguttaceae bacterium]|nr:hypothetical protein [Thermoguttaceae bacterium]
MNKHYRQSGLTGAPSDVKLAVWLLCALAVVPTFGIGVLFAQNGEGIKSSSETLAPNQKPTFWLLDENGSWRVPLPNWSLEDVERSIDARRQEAAVSPYSIQNIDAYGEEKDGVVRLTIEILANVSEGLVRVPLGLREGVYIPDAEHEGTRAASAGGFDFEGADFAALDVDPETGDYVAIIQTTAPKPQNADSDAEKTADPGEPAANEPAQSEPASPETPAEAEPAASESAQSEPASQETPAEVEPAPSEQENQETPAEVEAAPSEQDNQEPPAADEPAPSAQESQETPAEEPAPAEPAPEQTAFGRAPLAAPFAAKALDLSANAAASDGASVSEERGAARLRPRQVRLKLFLSFVVETVGVNEYRVCASFPASVGSQLTFTTSTPDVRVGSVKGAIASPSAIMDEGKSEMRFLGLGRGGERTEITWQRLPSSSSAERTAYQVEGAEMNVVLSAVDVKYDATVPTRVYGGESDVFYIRLPEGAEYAVNSLRAVNSSGASFALASEPEVKTEREICEEETLAAGAESESAGSEQNARSERRYLRITLEQPTSFVAFSLQASAAANRDADSRTDASKRMTLKIDGFSVCEYRRSESGGALVDAQKQTGKIVVSTPGDSEDLRFDVTPGFGASVGSDGAAGEQGDVFSFFAQPFTLTAQEYKRQEITNVKPEYRLTVDNNETKLRARFKFSVYGKKASEFYVRLYDWKFIEQHGELLDLGRIDSDPETGVTVLPLKAPADGEVLIDLELASDAELGSEKELRLFTLPTPEADRIEAAALVVVPSSNVEVDPDEANCAELSASSPRNLSIEMPAASTAQPALYFRTNQATKTPDKEIAPAVFAARVNKRDRELNATTELRAELSEKGEIKVTQKFNFNVKYEDLAGITLVVPPALASANGSKSATNFKYTVNGDAVPLYSVRDELDDLTGETLRRIPFNPHQIGAVEVAVQYAVQKGDFDLGAASTKYVDLFFLRALEKEVSSSDLVFAAPIRVTTVHHYPDAASANAAPVADGKRGSWIYVKTETSEDGATKSLRFHADAPQTSARVECSIQNGDNIDAAVVERAWIQSWFSNAERVDRAIYRVTTSAPTLYVDLPAGARGDRVAVTLDKTPIKGVGDASRGYFDSARRRLILPVSEELRKREFLLDISYVISNGEVGNQTGGSSDVRVRANGRSRVSFPLIYAEARNIEKPDETVKKEAWIRRAYWQAITPADRHIVLSPDNWTPEYVIRRDGRGPYFRRAESTSSEELSDWMGVPRRSLGEQKVNTYLFSSYAPPRESEFYMFERPLLFLTGSGLALIVGLGLFYFPSFRSPVALFILSLIALAVSAFNPTGALLFLQTTVVGIALTALSVAASLLIKRKPKLRGEVASLMTGPDDAKKRDHELQRGQGEGA